MQLTWQTYASQMEIILLLVPVEMTEGTTELHRTGLVYKWYDNQRLMHAFIWCSA